MKRFLLLLSTLLFVCACTSEFDQMNNGFRDGAQRGKTRFFATTETSTTSSPETKVYADENMKVLWNEGDQITVFNRITYNQGFEFDGEDGDTAGGFNPFTQQPTFGSWQKTDYIYAAYPYSKSVSLSSNGVFMLTLPAEQYYKEKSFGKGANTMTAITDDYFFAFKNVGGYLSLRLYGDNVSVSRITIKGNNGETIAGKASITMPLGGVPSIIMDETATDEISIVCDTPVTLGSSITDFTDFWFVIPPVTFEQGFTITVTNELGGAFTKSTSKSFTVNRNKLDWMNPLMVKMPEPTQGVFSVSENKKVIFSKGSVIQSREGDLSFANSQYYYVGEENTIDGALYYGTTYNQARNYPTDMFSTTFVQTSSNFASLGNEWSVLNQAEWRFLIEERESASQLIAHNVTVHGTTGIILLPDNWLEDGRDLIEYGSTLSDNSFDSIEYFGAVFIPYAGKMDYGQLYYHANYNMMNVGEVVRLLTYNPGQSVGAQIYLSPSGVSYSSDYSDSYYGLIRLVSVVSD